MAATTQQSANTGIAILNENIQIASAATSIDFVGAGVTGTALGQAVTETIPGGAGTLVAQETPSGTINGVNKIFTLAHTPTTGTLDLYLNGAYQAPGGVDYTLSTATITFVVAPVDAPMSVIIANYYY